MTQLPELDQFIRHAIKSGKNHEEIKIVLIQAGWDNHRLNEAFKNYCDIPFPVAVPKPKPYVSPRLVILNVFFFLVQYLTIYNVVATIFTMLDYYLPDGLGNYHRGLFYAYDLREAVQDNLSIIIVCAPMVYFTDRIIRKAMASTGQAIPRTRIKLVYLTLFIAACTMLTNATLFVYYLLRGELGMRFIIKVIILTITVAGLYYYYKSEVRKDEESA